MNKLLYILILNVIVANAYVEEDDTYEESMKEAEIVYMDTKDLASFYFLDGFVQRSKEIDFFMDNGYFETKEEYKQNLTRIEQNMTDLERQQFIEQGDKMEVKTFEYEFKRTKEQIFEPLKRYLYLYHIEHINNLRFNKHHKYTKMEESFAIWRSMKPISHIFIEGPLILRSQYGCLSIELQHYIELKGWSLQNYKMTTHNANVTLLFKELYHLYVGDDPEQALKHTNPDHVFMGQDYYGMGEKLAEIAWVLQEPITHTYEALFRKPDPETPQEPKDDEEDGPPVIDMGDDDEVEDENQDEEEIIQ